MLFSRMSKFPGAPFEMNVFIILISLITFVRGETRILHFTEGEETQLNFNYPCESAQVTLRYGYSAPFYDSANPESTSLPENQLLKVHNGSESDNCSLQLEINPVLRSDEGGYILTSYDINQNFLEDRRIGLRVDHPPGIASCEWSAENIVDDWGSLLCEAPAGTTPGLIACYQNGIRLPPRNAPTESGNIFQQAIWVRNSHTVFCCASLQEEPIDVCACKDFIWDPLNIRNLTDPCAAPLQDSTSPQSPEEDIKTNSYDITKSPPTTPKITKRHVPLHRGVLVIAVGTLVFITIILCVFLTAAFRKIRQITERKNDEQNYVSVPTLEAQLKEDMKEMCV